MKPEELQLGDIVTTTPSGMPIKVVAIHRKKDDVINDIHWVVDILDFNNGEWEDNNIWADTYEEAVEDALKYSLENLI